ncbi:MAG: hypothetical protein ABJZ55_16930 [Fuerstiella sp.]
MNDDFDQLDLTAAQLRLEFAAMVNMPRTSVTRTGKWVEGMVLPYLGLRFVLARKQYVRMILMPVILQTVIAVGLLSSFVLLGWLLKSWVQQAILAVVTYFRPETQVDSISEWSGVLVLALCGIACWYVFLVVWRISGGLLDDYFSDKITNRVMGDLGILRHAQSASVPNTILGGYRDAVLVHAGMALCSPLGLIPIVGVFAAGFGGGLIATFLHGTSQLITPLQGMGQSKKQALQTCFAQKWTVMGMAVSRDVLGPVPLFGGLMNAGEAVGRILLAARLLKLDAFDQQAISKNA